MRNEEVMDTAFLACVRHPIDRSLSSVRKWNVLSNPEVATAWLIELVGRSGGRTSLSRIEVHEVDQQV